MRSISEKFTSIAIAATLLFGGAGTAFAADDTQKTEQQKEATENKQKSNSQGDSTAQSDQQQDQSAEEGDLAVRAQMSWSEFSRQSREMLSNYQDNVWQARIGSGADMSEEAQDALNQFADKVESVEQNLQMIGEFSDTGEEQVRQQMQERVQNQLQQLQQEWQSLQQQHGDAIQTDGQQQQQDQPQQPGEQQEEGSGAEQQPEGIQ